MTKYYFIECKSAVSHSSLPGLDYTLNPYVGCEHGCLYCYERGFCRSREESLSWGKFVRVKANLLDALRHQLAKLPKGTVGVSTATDPYQPIEARLRLTRACLKLLNEAGFPISIQTKSALILKDIDLISSINCDVGITLSTLDRSLARRLEPRAASPNALVKVLERLSSRGIKTWVFLGPLIPELNDDDANIKEIIRVARDTNSTIIYDKLNLKPWVLDALGPLLEERRVGLSKNLPFLVKRNSSYWQRMRSKVERFCKNLDVRCEPAFKVDEQAKLTKFLI
ncbi:MAG: radical SAM protein [Nitrososphaerota archaeon]